MSLAWVQLPSLAPGIRPHISRPQTVWALGSATSVPHRHNGTRSGPSEAVKGHAGTVPEEERGPKVKREKNKKQAKPFSFTTTLPVGPANRVDDDTDGLSHAQVQSRHHFERRIMAHKTEFESLQENLKFETKRHAATEQVLARLRNEMVILQDKIAAVDADMKRKLYEYRDASVQKYLGHVQSANRDLRIQVARLSMYFEPFSTELESYRTRLTSHLPRDQTSNFQGLTADECATMDMFDRFGAMLPGPSDRKCPEATRRALASSSRHDRIKADPAVLCIYTDGSSGSGGVGCAVAIPEKHYVALRRLESTSDGKFNGRPTSKAHAGRQPVTVLAAELFGVVMGLEAAAEVANHGQSCAIFTDNQTVARMNSLLWVSHDGLGGEPLLRARAAMRKIEDKNAKVSVYWLARTLLHVGSYLAHHGANRATCFKGNHEQVLTARAWFEGILAQALGEARRTLRE